MSNPSQLVSICLPVFNGSKHLADSLDSILAQTYTNFELIVSDDCSKDSSAVIIEEYARRDSRIKVLHNEQNLGLFANYNRCMNQARGEFIKPFAQDDLLHPEALAAAIDVFSVDLSIVLISMNRLHINESGEAVNAHSNIDWMNQPLSADIDRSIEGAQLVEGTEVLKKCLTTVKNEIGEPTTVMFRADCKGTGFDESFRHLGDLEYWLRILMHGNYAFIETPLCTFRLHKNSATSTNKKLLLDSVELLRLGRLYGPALASMEGSRKNFYEKSMSAIFSESITAIEEYSQVINSQGINLSDDAKKLVGSVPSVEYFELALRVLAELHRVYRQYQNTLLYMAKMDRPVLERNQKLLDQALFGRVSSEKSVLEQALLDMFESTKRDRSARIRELEMEFSGYLNSRSWRMSRHLRELSRFVGGSDNDEAFGPSFHKKFDKQEVYETFLENQIWRLRNSLSWRLTLPIRHIESKLSNRHSRKVKAHHSVQNKV